MMDRENLDEYLEAYTAAFPFDSDNQLMLEWYSRRVVGELKRLPPGRLLSLGIGHKIVSSAILSELEGRLKHYTIVEGSPEMIAGFKAAVNPPDWVAVVEGWFEEYEPEFPLDAVELGFVLEHVDDPEFIIRRYREFLAPNGTMFIGVPNATSLHRQLGFEAGLLDNMYKLSAADLQLGHKRYFDLQSLTKLVCGAGLALTACEGIYLKPLTTGQLAQLELPAAVYQALCQVGARYPELSNGIYIEARKL